jgi:hypothetical protein
MMVTHKSLIFVAFLVSLIVLSAANAYAQDPTQDGINCQIPIVIDLDYQAEFPIIRNDFTCGKFDDYDYTCLEYYDGGEDIIYELNVEQHALYQFYLDPMGTPWTGMAISVDCPPPGPAHSDCLAYSFNQTPNVHGFYLVLEIGVYYLMIDTWPSPDCIPGFELSIQPVIIPPPKCQSPMPIMLPNDCPYTDQHQYTCGRLDEYNSTCMASYDGGEEMIYQVTVIFSGNYGFQLNPKTTTYTGMALGTECPPPGIAYGDCLAISTSTAAEPHGFVINLDVGNYYLMIDTWPSPNCIPDYDLMVYRVLPEYICGDANADNDVNVSDAIFIINFVFAGGIPPDPFEAADTNCDFEINVSDAVFIINYIFTAGNNPCDINGDGTPDC